MIGAGVGVTVGAIANASEASKTTLTLLGCALQRLFACCSGSGSSAPAPGSKHCYSYVSPYRACHADPGELYINGLLLFVVPYICTSMVTSQRPDETGDETAKGMGAHALKMYLFTTSCAVVEAMIYTNIFAPGGGRAAPDLPCPGDGCPDITAGMRWLVQRDSRGRDFIVAQPDLAKLGLANYSFAGIGAGVPAGASAVESILSIGTQILPRNIVKTFYSTNLLGLIVFSALFGRAIAKQPNSSPIFDMTQTIQDAAMSVVMVVVEFTRKVAMLSRFVALSVSLTQQVSLVQPSACAASSRKAWARRATRRSGPSSPSSSWRCSRSSTTSACWRSCCE